MSNYNDKMQTLLKEFRMAKGHGAFSKMKSLADEEFAKLIKGVPLNEAGHRELDEDTEMGIEELKRDGLDAVDILKALVYDVYHDESQHTVDMLKMMGYTDDQIGSDRDPMGSISNIAASEFIDMSDLEAETFLINYLKTLPVVDRSDDLRAIAMARQSAEELESAPDLVPPELEGIVSYLERHGLDLAADYEIEGDNVSEPYYLACRTIEIGDHIASVLDTEGPYSQNDDHPFKGQNLNVDHHRMNVTWQPSAPTMREMTRDFVKMTY